LKRQSFRDIQPDYRESFERRRHLAHTRCEPACGDFPHPAMVDSAQGFGPAAQAALDVIP
jgi:hypothetical protein